MMDDLQEIQEMQAEMMKAKQDDPLRSVSCPNCQSESYYWLKSSGRCAGCGFHWGIDNER